VEELKSSFGHLKNHLKKVLSKSLQLIKKEKLARPKGFPIGKISDQYSKQDN
jgi:hypothetical protein